MKYNKKYNRWITDDGKVYRQSKEGLFIECKQNNNGGYLRVVTKEGNIYVHRMVYETFIGNIPNGMEVDHIDTDKSNNNLSNLRLCTRTENNNNKLTKIHRSKALKNKPQTPSSTFGKKFYEHYGFTRMADINLYYREREWYKRNKKCRWE